MQIKTILVDLDGVLRLWPGETCSIEDEHLLPRGAIEQKAFSPAILVPVIRGSVSDDQWREQIANELQKNYPNCHAFAAVQHWSKSVGSVNPKAIEALSKIDSDVKVVLATNATSRLRADLAALGIHEFFHDIANSSELGYVKPEPEFYRAALKLAGSIPEETLFIDDTLENVDAAASLGMISHLYIDAFTMSTFISQYL